MMEELKYAEMTEKTAFDIVEKAFVTLKFLFQITPIKFSDMGKCGDVTLKCDSEGKVVGVQRTLKEAKKDNVEITYRVIKKGRIYKIQLWDSEKSFGYMSCSSAWNPATYIFCNFKEERDDGSKRCEMDFAFDIEKKTFVELFEIEYFNKSDLIRRCEKIEQIENFLFGKVILD